MKIDFHVHSKERSECASASEAEQIQAAMRGGLDAIVFSDHDYLVDRRHLAELNRKYAPFKIFTGIEVSLASEHVLVIGLADPKLESCDWEYQDLYRFVRRCNGFMALAHPFRYQDISVDLKQFPPDAIEVYSPNTPVWAESKIRQIAAAVGCNLLSDSDSHTPRLLGKYYNVLEDEPANDTELLQSLKKRNYKVCYEPSSSLPRF